MNNLRRLRALPKNPVRSASVTLKVAELILSEAEGLAGLKTASLPRCFSTLARR